MDKNKNNSTRTDFADDSTTELDKRNTKSTNNTGK